MNAAFLSALGAAAPTGKVPPANSRPPNSPVFSISALCRDDNASNRVIAATARKRNAE